jgi:hypothetical protein
MNTTALQYLAAIASTLKEGELRVGLELCRRHDAGETGPLSSRKLAERVAMARPNVQIALDSLSQRGLISSDGGSSTRGSIYHLNFLEVSPLTGPAVLPGRGIVPMPPPSQNSLLSGIVPMPPWHCSDATPGIAAMPPLASLQCHPPTENQELADTALRKRAPARLDRSMFDSNFVAVLDRLEKAAPKDYDPELIREVRGRLFHYKCKYGKEPHAHPPDDKLVARFLAIAPWPRLDQWLQDLALDRKDPGDTYGWFLAVAIQRLHGIPPEEQRRIRFGLRVVGKAKPAPPVQAELEPIDDLKTAIRAAAGRPWR